MSRHRYYDGYCPPLPPWFQQSQPSTGGRERPIWKDYRDFAKFMKGLESDKDKDKKKDDDKDKPRVYNTLEMAGLLVIFGPIVGSGYIYLINHLPGFIK